MKREKCIGNCGRMVLSALGSECRKCKKARLRAGLKNILKVTPHKKPTPRAETSKEKYHRVTGIIPK